MSDGKLFHIVPPLYLLFCKLHVTNPKVMDIVGALNFALDRVASLRSSPVRTLSRLLLQVLPE